VAKSDAISLTLTSITVSLAFVPLWLVAAPDLLEVRYRLTAAATAAGAPVPLTHRGVVAFFVLSLLLPVSAGFVAAIAYWQDWYPRLAGRLLPRAGIPAPSRGVGEDIWDRLWLNLRRQVWLTVHTKDGPVYVGRGVEFGYTRNLIQNTRDSGGGGVWIPAGQIVSIEIYDPPPSHTA